MRIPPPLLLLPLLPPAAGCRAPTAGTASQQAALPYMPVLCPHHARPPDCSSLIDAMAAMHGRSGLMRELTTLLVALPGQFSISVTQPMYHNVRLLVIERMGLPQSYDFHALVTNGMELELARAVGGWVGGCC